MSEIDFTIDEEIDEALGNLSEEELTQVLVITGQVIDGVITSPEQPIEDEDVQRIALRAFTAGYVSGQQDGGNAPQESSTDLLVGISPEDAATIVAGLLGDGATLTLSVIRQG